MKSALQKAREAPGSTKARILGAAEEVFAARGYEGASTRDIAARAGVNISSLHYHWESKETLYFAVFRNVFDQIVDLLENTLPPLLGRRRDRRAVVDVAMGALFDFFAGNPNVPKLLLRRIIDDADADLGIERDVLAPSWEQFSAWLARLGRPFSDAESRLFMLSVHSVLLVYLLDSTAYRSLLGGSVHTAPIRELATAKGVPVFHAPGRNADAVADLALAFMLMLARRLPAIQEAFRGGDVRLESAADFLALYTSFTGFELGGLTIGLVGLGAVGREVARRLLAFRARVIAADPHPAEVPPGVALVELDDLLREADIVSLHAPLMPETHGLLSRGRLAMLKPSAFLINTARAHLADEDALYEMLRDGRLAGAALDVLSDEPLRPGNRFLGLPSVIVTPHIGGATVDVVRHQSTMVVEAIEHYLRGERPRWIANPAVLDGRV